MKLASKTATLVRRCHHAESIEGGRHMPRNWGRFPQGARPSLSQPKGLAPCPAPCVGRRDVCFSLGASLPCGGYKKLGNLSGGRSPPGGGGGPPRRGGRT